MPQHKNDVQFLIDANIHYVLEVITNTINPLTSTVFVEMSNLPSGDLVVRHSMTRVSISHQRQHLSADFQWIFS